MELRTILLWLNLIVCLASTAWAVAALRRPDTLSSSLTVSPGELFYVRMYSARAVPFGIAAGVLPFWPGGPAAGWIVLISGLVQAADVLIGIAKQERGMIAGAAVGMSINVMTALILLKP